MKDFIKYIRKAIMKKKNILIKVNGEQRIGMSASAMSISNSFIKYFKKENKESEKRILINEREVSKAYRDFMRAI